MYSHCLIDSSGCCFQWWFPENSTVLALNGFPLSVKEPESICQVLISGVDIRCWKYLPGRVLGACYPPWSLMKTGKAGMVSVKGVAAVFFLVSWLQPSMADFDLAPEELQWLGKWTCKAGFYDGSLPDDSYIYKITYERRGDKVRFIKRSHLVKILKNPLTKELSTYVMTFHSKGFLIALDDRHFRHSVSDLHAVDVSCSKRERNYSPVSSAMSAEKVPDAGYKVLCGGQSYSVGDGLYPWFELEKSGMKMLMDEARDNGLRGFKLDVGVPVQLRCVRSE